MTKLWIRLQAIIPQHRLSRLVGWLAAIERPRWLKNLMIRGFMRAYGITLDDAKIQRIDGFPSFNAFFTRELAAEARPVASSRWLAPADGLLSQAGPVRDGQLVQAKGRDFRIDELLACDPETAALFHNGSFATVYLSPRDYHRVHMPISGRLLASRYVPGDLFAVNTRTAAAVDRLYARNERLVCHFDTSDGPLALVMVGAIIVAGIETVWGGRESPEPAGIRTHAWPDASGPMLAAGDELGRFYLGSTVVLVSARDDLDSRVQPGADVRVRGPLAD